MVDAQAERLAIEFTERLRLAGAVRGRAHVVDILVTMIISEFPDAAPAVVRIVVDKLARPFVDGYGLEISFDAVVDALRSS